MMIGAESRPVVTIPETEEERQALLLTRSSARRVKVKAGCTIEQTAHLDRTLRRLVIGQDQAVERIVCASSRLLSGLQDPDRPLLIIHANLSNPAPMSITLWSSVVCWPNSPWNSVNTALPSSNPCTKYSRDGPNEPPPAQTSSTKTTSSFLIPNCSVSNL